jgi:hypothetical protein
MLTLHTRRRSRSGISSLIGAIFFVLVVFLVFTSTILIFENFTGYATTFKQVNQGDVLNKNTVLSVPDLAFGGLTTVPVDENLPAVTNTNFRPYLPITNMNFTNSMNGWTFSRGYELSLHDGQVTNYPENVLPGLNVFTMVVSNLDCTPSCPAQFPLGTVITSVSLIVNPAWKVPVTPQVSPPPAGEWNTPPTVVGNTITWTANNVSPLCGNGINSNSLPPTQTFSWSAVAPPVSGTYLHDLTLTWETVNGAGTCSVARDQGTAAIKTVVVPSNQGGIDTEQIAAEPPGTVPGGSFGGLDSVSSNVGSESGPDSIYLSFQPTFNGNPITTTVEGGVPVPEQLTSQMNFTTYFTLDSPLTLAPESVCSSGSPVDCPVLSMGYSLDHAISGEPPLIFINAYLIYVPTGVYKQIINATAVNINNHGWFMNDTAFSLGPGTVPKPGLEVLPPPANTLPAGEYELAVTVTATMFGSDAPSATYPASLQMHLDDIGLGFQEAGTSYCVDTAATGVQPCAPTHYTTSAGSVACPAAPDSCGLYTPIAPVSPSQIQSLRFDAQLSISAPGAEVTAYAYLENVQASPTAASWVELGQVTFTSSASIDVTIPAASASSYLDEIGGLCSNISGHDPAGSMCIRIYAISTNTPAVTFGTLHVNASMVVQTWQQAQSSVIVLNNSTSPVHIVSVYVSGENSVYGNTTATGGAVCPPSCGSLTKSGGGVFVGAGLTTSIQFGMGTNSECNATVAGSDPTSLNCFDWTTGQTYVVTVTTDKGLVFSGTFVSP